MSATVAMALAGVVLSGCTSTYQVRKATPSGFLGDYSRLRAGGEDSALLSYVNPQTDFRKYDKILMDPVRVYAVPKSAVAKLPAEDLQRLVNCFDAAIRERLGTYYTFVTEPGPGVMRLRVAISEAQGSKVLLDTISTVLPQSIAISSVKRVALGSHTAVGSAGVECEALDSLSKERLFAAVDERVGRKVTGKFDKFDKWHTANDAFDYWAERLQLRLSEARNGRE